MSDNISDCNHKSSSTANLIHEILCQSIEDDRSISLCSNIKYEYELVLIANYIILLKLLNRIDDLSDNQMNSWIDEINKFQNEYSGYFSVNHSPGDNNIYNMDISGMQISYLCLQTLDALGAKPQHPLRFLDDINNIDLITGYFDMLEKRDTFLGSEWLKLILFFLAYRFEVDHDENSGLLYIEILDYLDSIYNKKSGLWGDPVKDIKNLICSAFQLLPFYHYIYRPIKYPTQLIESVFELITFDNLIINPRKNQPFTDLSSIYILSTLIKQRNYRKDDIKEVLTNSYNSLINLMCTTPFTNFFNDEIDPEIAKDDNFEYLNNKYSNLFLRAVSLAILERNLEELDKPGKWTCSNLPAISNFNINYEPDNDEQERIRNWIKLHRYSNLKIEESNTKAPTISVIIPCYNLGLYLKNAIESILSQTKKDFEIIIVNDGSTDNYTKLLLNNLNYPKTRVIDQNNQGLAASRNNGIEQALGKYICCLDADDNLNNNYYFERVIPILENDKEIGFVSGFSQTYDEWDQVYGSEQECNFPALLVNNRVVVPALFRKEAWNTVGGFYGGFSTMGIEDWDFWISVLESGYKSYFMPEMLYEYRVRSYSMAREMNEPISWKNVSKELVSRHKQTYIRYLDDYVSLKSEEWAVLLEGFIGRQSVINWWKTQSFKWKDLSEHNNHMLKEQEKWFKEQDSKIKEQDSKIKEQDSKIKELEYINRYNFLKYYYEIKKYFQHRSS